jgi:hypothetical protein
MQGWHRKVTISRRLGRPSDSIYPAKKWTGPWEENMTNFTSKRPLALALAMSTALVGGQAMADGHAIDLEGKTVEWIIPFSETGGSA